MQDRWLQTCLLKLPCCVPPLFDRFVASLFSLLLGGGCSTVCLWHSVHAVTVCSLGVCSVWCVWAEHWNDLMNEHPRVSCTMISVYLEVTCVSYSRVPRTYHGLPLRFCVLNIASWRQSVPGALHPTLESKYIHIFMGWFRSWRPINHPTNKLSQINWDGFYIPIYHIYIYIHSHTSYIIIIYHIYIYPYITYN